MATDLQVFGVDSDIYPGIWGRKRQVPEYLRYLLSETRVDGDRSPDISGIYF
jgi:hypothetical protein